MKMLLPIFFWSLHLPVCGQLTLTGSVLDAVTQEPLVGANIYLLANLQTGTASDATGAFQLTIQQRHIHDSLLITFVGYQEQVLALEQVQPVIYMQPREQEMPSISISADPLIAEEFQVVRIKKLEIYTNPAAKADPLLAVNALPSSTTTDESASISLRGSSSMETGIFLNNVPVYDAIRYAQLNGIGTFSLFNTALIRDVKVFPGNPPLEFGNTSSGVVAISTDEAAIDQNSHAAIISPANVGYQWNQKIGSYGLKTFTNYQPSYILKLLNKKAFERIKKFESLDMGIYLYGSPVRHTTLKSYTYGLQENYIYDFIHPTFRGDFNQKKRRAFNVSNISYQTTAGTFQWNQGYSISEADYRYSASDFTVINKAVFQGINFYQRSENLHFKFGMSWDLRASDVAGRFFTYDYAISETHPTDFVRQEVETKSLEAYAYSKYYLSDQWIVGAGLRKNLNELDQRNYLSKQLNLTHFIGTRWKVIAGLGEYNKFGIYENHGESIWIKSRQASIDLFFHKKQTEATLSIFAKSNDWEDTKRNIHGFELFIEQRIANRWSGDISYTYLSAGPDDDRSHIKYFLKSNLVFQPSTLWSLSMNSIFRQGLFYHAPESVSFNHSLEVFQPFIADEPDRHPDYFIINLAASRLFPVNEKLMVIVFASINNVTNHKNVRSYGYNFDYSKRTAELFSRRMIYFGTQIFF